MLLLIPYLALASAAVDAPSVDNAARAADLDSDIDSVGSLVKAKADAGSKIAPIDGKDGMPHNGPWVATTHSDESDDSSPDAINPKGKPMTMNGIEIPQSNDGVMDDPLRQPPKKGTTGTEGGVSEKEKLRKAQEGKTGEKFENVPETPKEDPRITYTKDTTAGGDTVDSDDFAGLEVRPSSISHRGVITPVSLAILTVTHN